MSLMAIALLGCFVAVVLILGGLYIVAQERGETTVTRTGNSTKVTKKSTSIAGEAFVGKRVAFRRKGSISAAEVGKLRAEQDLRLPRAVAAMVLGFSLLFFAVGGVILAGVGIEVLSVGIAGLLFFYGFGLPFGWFKRERLAKAEALAGPATGVAEHREEDPKSPEG